MKRPRALLIVTTVLIASLVVSAHDTWLSPREPTASTGTKAWLDLTSGMAFPLLETSINPDRVDIARCRLKGNTEELADQKSAPTPWRSVCY